MRITRPTTVRPAILSFLCAFLYIAHARATSSALTVPSPSWSNILRSSRMASGKELRSYFMSRRSMCATAAISSSTSICPSPLASSASSFWRMATGSCSRLMPCSAGCALASVLKRATAPSGRVGHLLAPPAGDTVSSTPASPPLPIVARGALPSRGSDSERRLLPDDIADEAGDCRRAATARLASSAAPPSSMSRSNGPNGTTLPARLIAPGAVLRQPRCAPQRAHQEPAGAAALPTRPVPVSALARGRVCCQPMSQPPCRVHRPERRPVSMATVRSFSCSYRRL
mmetsp:Transcript_17676/g.45251  ORF Transcript_17676/g.45251 Transcript_17676/m.45251 type:complete len:286 (-) Transcript_17676:11-868(-)